MSKDSKQPSEESAMYIVQESKVMPLVDQANRDHRTSVEVSVRWSGKYLNTTTVYHFSSLTNDRVAYLQETILHMMLLMTDEGGQING